MILSVDDLRRFESERLRQLEAERTLSDEEWRMVVAELSRRASTPSPALSAPPPPAPAPTVRRSAGPRTLGIAAASVALVVFVLAVSRPSTAPQVVSAAPAQPDIETTASEYFAAYQANEIAADARFKSRPLAVSAIVQSINKDFTDAPYLTLDARQGFLWVQASLDRSATGAAARLAPGSAVYLHCTGGGKFGPTPMLTGCTIQ